MSAEVQMTSVGETTEFPYRAMSSTAISSLVFAVLGFLFGVFWWPGLGLCAVGVLVGLIGYREIRRFPEEFDGAGLAMAGIAINLMIVLGLGAIHTYIYLTEVPDGYTRVHFYELQQDSGVPIDGPTERAVEINGQPVFLKGYIHPSSGSGLLKRFILVPDLGTCCFGGQPKSSDMIEVTLEGGQATKAGLTKKKLAGTFSLESARELTDFDNGVFYRMKVDILR